MPREGTVTTTAAAATIDQTQPPTPLAPHGRCGFCGTPRLVVACLIGGQPSTEVVCPNCTEQPKRAS